MDWNLITDIILVLAFLTLGGFGILFIYQLVTRKSIKKVDKQLILAFIPLILTAICYIVFDKFIVLNTRPNGSGEPSFPSSHVMAVATIFLLVSIALPKYIKSKAVLISLWVLMAVLVALTAVGRVLANMHWVSDVLGALGFSAIFGVIYFFLVKRLSRESRDH